MCEGPLVSVIVPVYNCERFLGDCLESLADQTYRHIEIVAVDDGSSDGSGRMLDAFAAVEPRCRVIHTQNHGLQAAWMTGVSASSGQRIGFVDADDWVHPAMFEILVDAAMETGALLIDCQLVPAYQRSTAANSECLGWSEMVWSSADGRETARDLLQGVGSGRSNMLPSRCLKLFDRDLLVANLKYCDGTVVMGEDMNILVPCLLDVHAVVSLEAQLYFYRQNPSSLTNTYLAGFASSNAVLLSRIRQAIREKGADLKGAEMAYFGWLSLRALVNECRGPGRMSLRSRRVIEMCGLPDVQIGLRLLRAADLDRSSRLVFYSCIWGTPFVSPMLVSVSDVVRRVYRGFRSSAYLGGGAGWRGRTR